ncbi:Uncharacterised protein [Mycobacteroides abscessus subsp. abscessus]|uniref:hypothetical protein n=1 Tax=Mycobacteroides abscessus TaxID=36809 RepID=UPI0009259807|nr:hypothetical protein [Mycobacteroides abscessus]SHU27353.1 Uncharacterised protein [Mycobacteroides abscessus subsp. abscessus]
MAKSRAAAGGEAFARQIDRYAITAGVLLLLTMLAVITITAGVLCGPLVQEIRDIRLQRRAQSQTSHTVAAPS